MATDRPHPWRTLASKHSQNLSAAPAWDQADLEVLDKGPIAPGPPPAQAVRRTVTILFEHDAVLRTYRLLFQFRPLT